MGSAQFMPKEVETHSEREKLMFRVKVRIDPELLKPYAERVKTGLPGVAYVRLDGNAEWPEHLKLAMNAACRASSHLHPSPPDECPG